MRGLAGRYSMVYPVRQLNHSDRLFLADFSEKHLETRVLSGLRQ